MVASKESLDRQDCPVQIILQPLAANLWYDWRLCALILFAQAAVKVFARSNDNWEMHVNGLHSFME